MVAHFGRQSRIFFERDRDVIGWTCSVILYAEVQKRPLVRIFLDLRNDYGAGGILLLAGSCLVLLNGAPQLEAGEEESSYRNDSR